MSVGVVADYYDGRSARRHVVTLTHEHGLLQVRGDGVDRRAALAELRLSEPMGQAPRLVTFPDGAFCEIRDHARFQALLDQTGTFAPRIVRWQSSWRWQLVATLLFLACLFAGYRWALPWAAARIADGLPVSVDEAVSERVLSLLDAHYLAPSRLPAARQQEISRRFSALREPGAGAPDAGAAAPDYRLLFRANRAMPANALALPSGTIILTDDLVRLARNDSELLAVLAHELGHVRLRHGMRQAVQSTLVGVLAAWFLGDVSSIVAAAPAALLEAKYSRDAERDADRFALRLLAANGLSPRCLGDILVRLERQPQQGAGSGEVAGFLSTHPATQQRIAAMTGPACE